MYTKDVSDSLPSVESSMWPYLPSDTQLEIVRRGAAVKRFHTIPTIHENTVGQHTFGCLALLHVLYDDISLELVKYVLMHDISEQVTGDIPSPAKKRGYVTVNSLSYLSYLLPTIDERDRRRMKLVDVLDGMLFCIEERLLGNLNVVEVFNTYKTYAEDLIKDGSSSEKAVWKTVLWKWEASNG